MLHVRLILRNVHSLNRIRRRPGIPIGRDVSYNAKGFVPNDNGPNIHIIRWLTKEMENESHSDDQNRPYKARAFQRACKVIDALPEPITSGKDAMKVVGIGEGIARRIDEYFSKGPQHSPSKPPSSQKTPDETKKEKCLEELKRVPGLGTVKAQKLYDAGCRSLDDLRKPEHAKSLSAPIRAALDYVDHLGERVTRAEVESVMDTIRPLLSSEIKMHAVGSYRRGLTTCSDVDIIFFHPSCVHVPRPGEKASNDALPTIPTLRRRGRPPKRERQDTLLRELVLAPLERAGVLAATLTEGSRKWQGIVRIRRDRNDSESGSHSQYCIFRRMDLSLYPTLSEGAALLATTGDSDFNAHVRRNANKMGLLLNEFGLWKFCRHSPASVSTYEKKDRYTEEDGHWELVASRTETEVLDALGVEYVEPERRNFTFVVSKSRQGKGSLLKSRGTVSKELHLGPQT